LTSADLNSNIASDGCSVSKRNYHNDSTELVVPYISFDYRFLDPASPELGLAYFAGGEPINQPSTSSYQSTNIFQTTFAIQA
jgi:hypothetical protein